jgi:hypothetical protein
MTTSTENIGMAFEITIPGHDPVTHHGDNESAWKYVCERMNGVEGIPTVKRLDTPAPAPAPAPMPAIPVVTPEPAPVAAPVTHREAVAQGVNAEGAARSTADLLAAQASGFTPERPYFDRGTPVIGLGVQNARASATEHAAKPKLPAAVDGLIRCVEGEHRRDVTVSASSLAMYANGDLAGPDGARWALEEPALAQIAQRSGIPHASYLAQCWPALRAQNWNQWIATMTGHERSTCPADHLARKRLADKKEAQIMCRLRDDPMGKPAVWAALSNRYGVYDVDQIAIALRDGLSAYPEARCEIEYNGSQAQFDVLFHSDVKPEHYVAGEFFKAGIRVKTSDAGGGSISVGLLIWQNLCLNLLCIDVGTYAIDRIKHLGDPKRLAERFAAAVQTGEDRLAHFLRAWGYACGESLASVTSTGYKPEHVRLLDEMEAETVSETDLLGGIFLGLGQSGLVSVGKADLPGLLAAHAFDKSGAVQLAPVTRASIVNAVTRYAHVDVGRSDPMRQHELESEAGALLAQRKPSPLPFAPPTSRQRVAV